jgi:hypothetical protein
MNVAICNMALGEVPANAIQSADENSREARACRRVYDDIRQELLSAHHWYFARRRIVLAEVPNTRFGEWAYAYDLPAGAAPIRVIPTYTASYGVFQPLVGQRLAPLSRTGDDWPVEPYHIEGDVLFCGVPTATLVYSDMAVSEEMFPPLFRKAFYLSIAAAVVLELTQSQTRKRELEAQTEVARERAMAADLNAIPRQYAHYPSYLAARI